MTRANGVRVPTRSIQNVEKMAAMNRMRMAAIKKHVSSKTVTLSHLKCLVSLKFMVLCWLRNFRKFASFPRTYRKQISEVQK